MNEKEPMSCRNKNRYSETAFMSVVVTVTSRGSNMKTINVLHSAFNVVFFSRIFVKNINDKN